VLTRRRAGAGCAPPVPGSTHATSIGELIVKTLSLLLLIVLASGCATYSKPKSAINAFYGVRSLENDDFDDIDDATVWGGELLLGITSQGLGIEGGYANAEQDGGPLFSGSSGNVETDEFYVGLRNTWNTDSVFQPYIGAGAAWLDANAESSGGFDDDDDSAAAYARAGLGWQFTNFQIGVDGRVLLGTDFEFDSNDTDLDYLQILAFIGWSF
jgi:hypothetical protein